MCYSKPHEMSFRALATEVVIHPCSRTARIRDLITFHCSLIPSLVQDQALMIWEISKVHDTTSRQKLFRVGDSRCLLVLEPVVNVVSLPSSGVTSICSHLAATGLSANIICSIFANNDRLVKRYARIWIANKRKVISKGTIYQRDSSSKSKSHMVIAERSMLLM